ncbi:Rpn family recombination-promoting nuclease/putative transposase [Alcaligenaceae bacterium]|nr:Rpn family recombination-promoting nuclease/putative transposase [Alcaligenaceae bacterium]
MSRQDAIYRRLLKHPRMLRDLLACVMDADWLQDLDWTGLQELDTHYVAERLQQRIGDGAWRIPYRSGQAANLYVLLMLEHQSRADTYMALRMATYAGLLYQSLLRQKLIVGRLPPVLPVVLYSGRRPWRAHRNLADLIEPSATELSSYQLQLRYLLIDEGELLRAGGLPDRNLAALLFRLEHSTAIEEIPELLHTLMRVVQGTGFEELNRSLTAYIQHLVLSRAKPMEPVPTVTTLQELAMLISEKPGIWARQWEQEGIQKGRREGRKEGRKEGREEGREEGRNQGRQEGMQAGQAALLERLLIRKFGSLPEALIRRIRQGTPVELEAWSLNLIDADSLEQVFATKNLDSHNRP